jgi:hypothetical protein
MMDLRKQIKKEMDHQKINTSQMARRIGCAQQTLYGFFEGGNMTAKYIEAVLNELKFTLTIEGAEKKKGYNGC